MASRKPFGHPHTPAVRKPTLINQYHQLTDRYSTIKICGFQLLSQVVPLLMTRLQFELYRAIVSAISIAVYDAASSLFARNATATCFPSLVLCPAESIADCFGRVTPAATP